MHIGITVGRILSFPGPTSLHNMYPTSLFCPACHHLYDKCCAALWSNQSLEWLPYKVIRMYVANHILHKIRSNT